MAYGRWPQLRTGRKNPRTLYIQRREEEARDDDPFIGALDRDWADVLVHAYNAWLEAEEHDTHKHYWRETMLGAKVCPCGAQKPADA